MGQVQVSHHACKGSSLLQGCVEEESTIQTAAGTVMSNDLKTKAIQQEFMQELKPTALEGIFRLSNQLITGGYRAAVTQSVLPYEVHSNYLSFATHVTCRPPNMIERRLE